MFDSDLSGCDAEATLEVIDRARAASFAAEVQLLRAAAHWADLHAAPAGGARVMPGCERLVRIGGDGTPTVAEFAPAELATTLETSTRGGQQLVADALDLRHRLPLVWARVEAGEVKPWLARNAAQATHHHPLALARRVDAVIAPWADRLSVGRLESLIEATATRLDPAGAARREGWARDQLGVWLSPESEHGTTTLFARLDAPDALAVDHAVQAGAEALAALGDPRGLDQRRATALGLLADPHDTFELHHAATTDQPGAAAAGGAEVDPGSAAPDARPCDPHEGQVPAVFTRRDFHPRRDVRLYVHLTDQAIRTGEGVARVEGIGPVTAGLVRDWLPGARISVVPVLDLNQMAPVDGYEIPTRLAEAVRLRSPVDAFPYSTCTSRRMDLDHTIPYRPPDQGGPPGQTRPDNLAPLTRAHHRIKTHGGWQVKQVWDGVLVWRSPHGRHYLVDHTGTTKAITAA